jgi:hypothetical protein
MTWISVNPNGEPFTRKFAAVALSRQWGNDATVAYIDNLSSTELADLYNSVEALGLDLYTLRRDYSEFNADGSKETP